MVNTKNIVISQKITLLPDAEFEGSFLKTFSEPSDEDTNEDIDLCEKTARIDTKIAANNLQNGNNAAAISTRHTKGQTDSMFARNTNPYITGDINIRDDMSTPFESLFSKLSTKVDDAQLENYTTLEKLSAKADLSVSTADYVTKNKPEFLLTESDRYNEIGNSLEDMKVTLHSQTTTPRGFPMFRVIETNMKNVLDDRYKLMKYKIFKTIKLILLIVFSRSLIVTGRGSCNS